MADVQLEHGHFRLANRLAEAMLDAEFSGVQFKILHTLIRLTYGWRRRTVTLSHAELAGYMHTTASGNFRAALRELIAEGVVIQAERGTGGKRSTYAIEKDFTRWGRFEVGAGRLARIYGTRPESDDDALVQANLFRDQPRAPESGTTDDPSPNQADAPARIRPEPAPESGIPTGSKSLPADDVDERKDRERQGKTEEQLIAERGGQSEAEAALREVMGPLMADVTAFLALRPAENRGNWYPELLQMVGPATGAVAEDLAGACRDALIADPPCTSPVGIRAFVRQRRRERLIASIPDPVIVRTGESSSSPAVSPQRARDAEDDAVWSQALDVVERFKAGTMTGEAFRALPFPLRHAIRMAGGWRALYETKPGSLPFVRRDFLKSYHSAPTESSPPATVPA